MKYWPVCLLLLAHVATGVEPVTLLTADKVEVAATFYPADDALAPSPAVILLHEAGRTREIWRPLATLLQRNGIAALALDLRGHGESIRQLGPAGPAPVDAQAFTPKDYQDMLLDLNAAFDWLTDRPEVDESRVAILGSVLGANLALRYALFNDDLAALVLLSPVIEYQGLRADDAMEKLGPIPLRIVVAAGDNIPFASAKKLIELRRAAGKPLDGRELIATTGAWRGTDLLRGVENLTTVVVTWLREQLQVNPPAP